MAEDNEKLKEQVETLQKQMDELIGAIPAGPPVSLIELQERIANLEETNPAAFENDIFTPDMSRSGDLMDVRKMPMSEEVDFKVLPFEIEFGVPKADVAGSSATVELRPTDEYGLEFTSAADLTVYVANDRQIQLLEDREWRKKVTGTMVGQPVFGDPESTVTADAIFTEEMVGQRLIFYTSGNSYLIEGYTSSTIVTVTGDAHDETNNDTLTVSGSILSFIRFSPWVAASSNIAGVLIGEARDDCSTFPARLLREAPNNYGEYDQWEEVETDTADPNTWQTKIGGRTHTNTGESLWEANKVEDIPTSYTCSWSTVVWVHEEAGDEHRYVFDFQRMRGDGTCVGTKAAPAGISSDAAEWIQIENDGRMVRAKHCPPGPYCYSIGEKCACSYWFNYFELDQLGHVRVIGAYCGCTWSETCT